MTRLTIHGRAGATVSTPGLPDLPLDPQDPGAILGHLDDVVALAGEMSALDVAEALRHWERAASAVARTDIAAWRRGAAGRGSGAVLRVTVRPVLLLMRGAPGRRREAVAALSWRACAELSGRPGEVPLIELHPHEWGGAPLYLEERARVVDGPAAFTGTGTLPEPPEPASPVLSVAPTLHSAILRGLFGDLLLPPG